MLTIAGQSRGRAFCDGLSRRDFLRIGGLALGGLSLPQLLRAEADAGIGTSHKAIIMIFLAGFGMVSPLATATSLQPFGDRAGLASALLGFLQMAGAAVGTLLTASIASATLAVGIVQASLTMLGLLLYLVGGRSAGAR